MKTFSQTPYSSSENSHPSPVKFREVTEDDIRQFLEYHNRPGVLGFYARVRGGSYPLSRLNLTEYDFWLMAYDFCRTFHVPLKAFMSAFSPVIQTVPEKEWRCGMPFSGGNRIKISSAMSVFCLTVLAQSGSHKA